MRYLICIVYEIFEMCLKDERRNLMVRKIPHV